MEHSKEKLATIVLHLGTIDDYETWKTMVMTVAKSLAEYPSEPLLDVIFDRAEKQTKAGDPPSLKETIRKLMIETEIYLSVEGSE